MSETAQRPDLAHQAITFADVKDEFGGIHGRVIKKFGQVGKGGNKIIEGEIFVYQPIGTDDEIFLGTAGSLVVASPLLARSRWEQRQILGAFTDEEEWMESFAMALKPVASTARNPFLLREDTPERGKREFQQKGIAFGESPEDIFEMLWHAGNSLSDGTKSFILLSSMAKASRVLEDFHSQRMAVDWKEERGLVHGDIGQYDHLSNILIPGRGGFAVMIDYSHVEDYPESKLKGHQEKERIVFINTMLQRIHELGLQHLLPQDILHYFHQGDPQRRLLEYFNAQSLGHYAAEQLKEVVTASGEEPIDALYRIRDMSFLATLDTRIARQVHQRHIPKVILNSIVHAADSLYEPDEAPTQIMQAAKLHGPGLQN